ncbi:MAG TPA: hypothetical protein VF843_10845 [Streptosporangiaceae bacterium]
MVGFLILAAVLLGLLPVLAWWLTGRMVAGKPPYAGRRRDARGFPMGPADAWLAEPTDLSALQRRNVQRAVLSGRPATPASSCSDWPGPGCSAAACTRRPASTVP